MKKIKLYSTSVEAEAYDLGERLTLAKIRSHVEPQERNGGKLYAVMLDAPEMEERARAIRGEMFGTYRERNGVEDLSWMSVEELKNSSEWLLSKLGDVERELAKRGINDYEYRTGAYQGLRIEKREGR